jgi:hypothetical protein
MSLLNNPPNYKRDEEEEFLYEKPASTRVLTVRRYQDNYLFVRFVYRNITIELKNNIMK